MTETTLDLADVRMEHFEPLVGQRFVVRHPEATEELVLEAVEKGKMPPTARFPRQSFSLSLRATTPELLLLQAVHPLEHPALGRLELFLVPIGREPDGLHRYQIVFS